MNINFENISLLVSGCIDLLANKKCAQVAWTYLNCNFVLSLHGPIWSLFCAQVAQTYKIAILFSVHMDLYDCHFVLSLHRPIWSVLWSAFCTQVAWTYFYVWPCSTEGLWIYHFVLRPHGPTWLPFCAQVTWTYMIAILHSGHMDYYILYYNAALCHQHLPFIPIMYTCTVL